VGKAGCGVTGGGLGARAMHAAWSTRALMPAFFVSIRLTDASPVQAFDIAVQALASFMTSVAAACAHLDQVRAECQIPSHARWGSIACTFKSLQVGTAPAISLFTNAESLGTHTRSMACSYQYSIGTT
jgi:hypothetical protein